MGLFSVFWLGARAHPEPPPPRWHDLAALGLSLRDATDADWPFLQGLFSWIDPMKPIVSRLSDLILRSKPSPFGRRLASRRMAACTAVARGHPSQGDAKHRPETHRLRDAPQDEGLNVMSL
jgi:hypothetical protein